MESMMVVDVNRMLSEEEMFCLEGCRSYKQYYSMRQGFESGTCAFCTINPELNVVVWEDDHMRVWHVHPKFMRPELKLHILIAPKRHVRFLGDLSIAEWVSLGCATEFAQKHFGYTGGMFHAREGDMRNNAGTVPHLHVNIFEPNGTGEVRVPVFKDIADRAENQARARQFSGHYGQNVTPDQFNQMVKAGLMNEDGYTT
jgi:diadenosine tetraphosphate (Ap4A) HIT family hydrolase